MDWNVAAVDTGGETGPNSLPQFPGQKRRSGISEPLPEIVPLKMSVSSPWSSASPSASRESKC